MRRYVVHCTDLRDIIATIIQQKPHINEYIIKLGSDGGRGSLKVCIEVMASESSSNKASPSSKRLLIQAENWSGFQTTTVVDTLKRFNEIAES